MYLNSREHTYSVIYRWKATHNKKEWTKLCCLDSRLVRKGTKSIQKMYIKFYGEIFIFTAPLMCLQYWTNKLQIYFIIAWKMVFNTKKHNYNCRTTCDFPFNFSDQKTVHKKLRGKRSRMKAPSSGFSWFMLTNEIWTRLITVIDIKLLRNYFRTHKHLFADN